MRAESAATQLRLAIVGRPNVGKSSIINAILGQDRVIVSEIPGTTRDAVDTPFEYKEHPMVLVDTAGIRRPGKVERGVEKYSVMRAREAIERCDIAILVLDASEKVAPRTCTSPGYVAEAYKGMIVAVNKWDLLEDTDDNRMDFAQARSSGASASRHGRRWHSSRRRRASTSRGSWTWPWTSPKAARRAYRRRRSTRSCERPSRRIRRRRRSKRPIRIKFATQAEMNPPTFVFFTNDASLLHFSYRRYLENAFRRRFGFEGTAIKLVFRSRST